MMLLVGLHSKLRTLQRVVEAYSTTQARLLGVYPQKGVIQLGIDGDLVLIDLEQDYAINNNDVISKAGWTPFHGKTMHGVPLMTIRRGEILTQARKLVAPALTAGSWLRGTSTVSKRRRQPLGGE